MPRVTNAPASRKRRKRRLDQAKGFRGARSKLYRTATESVNKALQYSYRDRRVRKRDMRSLWIVRINAAARMHGLSYNQFMKGLKEADVTINRKMLADLAVREPETFAQLVETAKNAVAAAA